MEQARDHHIHALALRSGEQCCLHAVLECRDRLTNVVTGTKVLIQGDDSPLGCIRDGGDEPRVSLGMT